MVFNPENWWYWNKCCKYQVNTWSCHVVFTAPWVPGAEVCVSYIFSRSSEDCRLCSLYHKDLKTTLMWILGNGIRRTWKLRATFLALHPVCMGKFLYLCVGAQFWLPVGSIVSLMILINSPGCQLSDYLAVIFSFLVLNILFDSMPTKALLHLCKNPASPLCAVSIVVAILKET